MPTTTPAGDDPTRRRRAAALSAALIAVGHSGSCVVSATNQITLDDPTPQAQAVADSHVWTESNPPMTADELTPLVTAMQAQVAALIAAPPPVAVDPWTYRVLSADFATSSAAAANVTGLDFTPVTNQRYEFEAVIMVRTAVAATGPRVGVAWPTGMSDGCCRIDTPSSGTAVTMVLGGIVGPLLAAVGGLPSLTASFPVLIRGVAITGAVAPVGSLRVQLASETALTSVTARAGSYLRYRPY